jgi:hypothetical protein
MELTVKKGVVAIAACFLVVLTHSVSGNTNHAGICFM